MPRIRPLVTLCAAILIAGCSAAGSTPSAAPSAGAAASVLPVIISSELATGPNRFLFSFVDATSNSPVGAPDRSAGVAFSGPGG
jgi:hypothetical protein